MIVSSFSLHEADPPIPHSVVRSFPMPYLPPAIFTDSNAGLRSLSPSVRISKVSLSQVTGPSVEAPSERCRELDDTILIDGGQAASANTRRPENKTMWDRHKIIITL